MKVLLALVVILLLLPVVLRIIARPGGPDPGRGSQLRRLGNGDCVACVGGNHYQASNAWYRIRSGQAIPMPECDAATVSLDVRDGRTVTVRRQADGPTAVVAVREREGAVRTLLTAEYVYDARLLSDGAVVCVQRDGVTVLGAADGVEAARLPVRWSIRIAVEAGPLIIIDTSTGAPVLWDRRDGSLRVWDQGLPQQEGGPGIPTQVACLAGRWYLGMGRQLLVADAAGAPWRVLHADLRGVFRGFADVLGGVAADDAGIWRIADPARTPILADNRDDGRLVSSLVCDGDGLCVGFYRLAGDLVGVRPGTDGQPATAIRIAARP